MNSNIVYPCIKFSKKKKIISVPQGEGKRIPFLIIKCSFLVKAFRNPCLLIRLLHLLLGRASMGGGEEEEEGKELHSLHRDLGWQSGCKKVILK